MERPSPLDANGHVNGQTDIAVFVTGTASFMNPLLQLLEAASATGTGPGSGSGSVGAGTGLLKLDCSLQKCNNILTCHFSLFALLCVVRCAL
jgi:hypothetical protein